MLRTAALVALLVSWSNVGGAAEWHVSETAQPRAGTARSIAERHLATAPVAWRLGGLDLEADGVLVNGRYRTVRFEQRYAGLRVIGGHAVVRVAPDGRVSVTMLDVARDLDVDPVPQLTLTEALVEVTALSGRAPVQHELVVLRSLGLGSPGLGRGRLVWQVDVPTPRGGTRYWLDAHDGSLVAEHPLGIDVLGRVYPVSSVNTPATQDVELVDLVSTTPQLLTGWNGNLVVTNYLSGSVQDGNYLLEQTVQPNVGTDFLFDPPASSTDPADPFAQVGIYYHLTRMRDFFTSALGVDTSSPSWKLVAVANVKENGQALDNAFFSPIGIGAPWSAPNLIGIGQGSSFDFAQDSDVFNHEFTHYVTANAIGYNAGSFHFTDYGRSPFSAAIDEGLSDYFACTVNGDPELGEASLALFGLGRDLSDTSKACPNNMFGEAHEDGKIIGSFAWSMRSTLGPEIADQLVWGATTLLPYGATFADFGRGIQQTADELVAEGVLSESDRQGIDATLAERGIDICDAEIPLTAEKPITERTRPFNNCAEAKAENRYRQSMFHYRVTPGPEAQGIVLTVSFDAADTTQLSWNIYARTDQHVTFMESFPPTLAEFDYAFEEIVAPTQEIVIDAQSDPPFRPDATYHFVLRHQNCTQSNVTFSTRDLQEEPTGEGGAGGSGGAPAQADPSEPSASGCACRTAGPSEYGPFGLLLVPLLIARRRSAGRSASRFARQGVLTVEPTRRRLT